MMKTKFLSLVLSLCMVLSICSISAWAEPTLNLGDFDYSNIKISLSANTSDSSASEAMVYIYKSDGYPLSDGNLPVYADFIPLTAGAFQDKEIILPRSLAYDSYIVAVFYDESASPIMGSFRYYSPSEILEIRKNEILQESKAASDADSLRDVFFDADSAGGTRLPTNDIIVASNADFTDYNSVTNKLEVYNRMIVEEYKSLTSFESLIALFETCASAQKEAENRVTPSVPKNPSNNNTTPGNNKGTISVSDSTGGSVSGGNVSGSTQNEDVVFNDMTSHWAFEYAKVLSGKKIVNGYEDGSFKPENNVTRAELTKMLVTAFNINGAASVVFSDVTDDSWYKEYISKASGAEIITGYNGLFNPDGNITRQDAALMVYRTLEKIGKQLSGTSQFNDDTAIAAYASTAVKTLGAAGILTGDTNGNFNPTSAITRAEIAALLCRALDWTQLN